MARCTKAFGETTSKKGMELKIEQMVQSTKESTNRGRNMDMESSYGVTAPNMKETFMKMISTAKALMYGVTGESTRETGRTTGWKAEELSHGLMEEFSQETIWMTKK